MIVLTCERREMSVYLRREVDTKESSLIRRSINKVGVTSLFALKERKYLNIIYGFVWFACGVVYPVINKYHLIVRGLFTNFKAPTILTTSSLCSLVIIIVGALKFGNKPLTIRKYLLTTGYTT